MKKIDFSCKHDVLIQNRDGTLLPMDEPYFESRQIAPGTWQIRSDGDYLYLVEGAHEALVIDSGYGCGNLRDYCQSLTDKPVRRIVNTHDHFDHTANNCYFECAYMSKETQPLATIPYASFRGIDFPRDYPVEIIGAGYIFDLGGRTLETFSVTDHAPGSLLFLDRKERLLFSGDEIMPRKTLNHSVSHLAKQLTEIVRHSKEFDRICGGFEIFNGALAGQMLENLNYILAGNEGVNYIPKKRPPKSADPLGRTIYPRGGPRPGDGGAAQIGTKQKMPLRMEYAGCIIDYDADNVYEE